MAFVFNPLTGDFDIAGAPTVADIALPDGKIIVGNASNVGAAVNMSGDATISNTGAVSLASSIAGVKTLTDATNSTSSTTGALIVSGGVGVAKTLYVGSSTGGGGTQQLVVGASSVSTASVNVRGTWLETTVSSAGSSATVFQSTLNRLTIASSQNFTDTNDGLMATYSEVRTPGNSGVGTLSKVTACAAAINSAGTSITFSDAAAFRARAVVSGGGTPVYTQYAGINLEASGVTGGYGIYQAGTSDKNYLAGATTIGGTSTTPQHVINSAVKTNGAQVGTLTNAPSAGNPAGYLQITINGTTAYIPYWV